VPKVVVCLPVQQQVLSYYMARRRLLQVGHTEAAWGHHVIEACWCVLATTTSVVAAVKQLTTNALLVVLLVCVCVCVCVCCRAGAFPHARVFRSQFGGGFPGGYAQQQQAAQRQQQRPASREEQQRAQLLGLFQVRACLLAQGRGSISRSSTARACMRSQWGHIDAGSSSSPLDGCNLAAHSSP
jgi:hypothetical protein